MLTFPDSTDRPVKLCYTFSISGNLTQMVNVPIQIPDCDSQSLLVWFYLSDHIFCSLVAFPPLENSNHVDPTILVWIKMVFVIIWLMFHGRILSLVLLWLLLTFVSRSRMELMYISFMVNISFISMVFSCLCCFHSSQKPLLSLASTE